MNNETDKKFPNLELISRDNGIKYDERRNLPRLCLTSEQFRLTKTGRIFSVTDLSENGMGLWLIDQNDLSFFSVGLLVEGTLNLNRQKFEVNARARNLSKDRVGFEFENLSEETKQAIRNFLDPSVLGAELKPIPSQELSTLWYNGPSGTDLVLRRSADGQFEKFTLYVLGTYVQWERDQNVSTGKVASSDQPNELRGIMRLETLLLIQDVMPDRGKLAIAKTVIMSSNLPQDLKSKCVRQLNSV
jgi:hypothetical protein